MCHDWRHDLKGNRVSNDKTRASQSRWPGSRWSSMCYLPRGVPSFQEIISMLLRRQFAAIIFVEKMHCKVAWFSVLSDMIKKSADEDALLFNIELPGIARKNRFWHSYSVSLWGMRRIPVLKWHGRKKERPRNIFRNILNTFARSGSMRSPMN